MNLNGTGACWRFSCAGGLADAYAFLLPATPAAEEDAKGEAGDEAEYGGEGSPLGPICVWIVCACGAGSAPGAWLGEIGVGVCCTPGEVGEFTYRIRGGNVIS